MLIMKTNCLEVLHGTEFGQPYDLHNLSVSVGLSTDLLGTLLQGIKAKCGGARTATHWPLLAKISVP